MPKASSGTPPSSRPGRTLDETYDLMLGDPDEYIRELAKGNPIIFAEANLHNEKGERLEFSEQHNFQVDYIKDYSRRICVVKSSQVGITTSSIVKVLYLAHLNTVSAWSSQFGRKGKAGITAIYTFPTANDVFDFSSTRFSTMIRSSKVLIDLMGGNKKKSVDAVGRRIIGNSLIAFRGTQKDSQAISIPADLIVNDELDFSNQDVIDVFDSRLTHSDLKWWWKFSTPTIPNYGIDAEYRRSDQKRWVVRCSSCGKNQEIDWPENVKRKKIGGKTYAYWGCRRCAKELDRTTGGWQARHPNRQYSGYYIPPTICPWIQPLNIVESKRTYKTEKGFRNFALGQAFTSGADVITREMLLSRFEFGSVWNPITEPVILMGVDQGDLLHYTISRMRGGRRETLAVGTKDDFSGIAGLMQEWNVNLCVMDALPNKQTAKHFAKDFEGRVLLSIYKDFDEEMVYRPSLKMDNGILVDRTDALDMSAASWRDGESVFVLDGHQYNQIPKHIDEPAGKDAFIQQMGNMVRDEQEDKKTGKSRAVWVKTGPDHYRHADTYNLLAYLQRKGGDIRDLMTTENLIMSEEHFQRLPAFAGPRSDLRSPF